MSLPTRVFVAAVLASAMLGLLHARADDPWPPPGGVGFKYGAHKCKPAPSKDCWQAAPCQQNNVITCENTQPDKLKATQWRQYGYCEFPFSSSDECIRWSGVYCAKLTAYDDPNCDGPPVCSTWISVGPSTCEP